MIWSWARVSLIVVYVTPVASCNVYPSLYSENLVHYSVVISVHILGFVQFVNLMTIVLVTWLNVQGVVVHHIGLLLLVHVGLPGGPLLVSGVVERRGGKREKVV